MVSRRQNVQKLKSRKFILAIIGAVVMLVNGMTELNLNATEIAGILLPIIAYIMGEAWVDSRRNGK